jgi:polyferredoxin
VTRDLLNAPGIGTFLRWRHARTALQVFLLLVATLVILDGLYGPPLAPRNLAGVIPWLHWRGFVVLAILVFGNLFCMACPFMLPRRIAKRLLPGNRHWPTWLRSKWPAAALLVVFFWAYEAYDLWESPWLTAWVAVAYFLAAFLIDGIFKGAAFCKYLCPIGQFHFVNSTISPVEVAVREPALCDACHTKDCIVGRVDRGTPLPVLAPAAPAFLPEPPVKEGSGSGDVDTPRSGRLAQRGCELWLFQPKKVGNMDCTFCLECVHACPHGNVGLLLRQPGEELWADPHRSSLGRFSQRPDLAFLVLVLVFAAFLNAFGMVTPVYSLLDWMASAPGFGSEPLRLGIIIGGGVVLLPLILAGLAAAASRTLSGSGRSVVSEATRYVYGLVPLGFGMWLAHYLFHFLLGALTILPLLVSYLMDLGISPRGPVDWGVGPLVPEAWLGAIQFFFLELGLLVSLVVLWRIAHRDAGSAGNARRAFLPWAGLAIILSVAGIWLLSQPMEMRGTMMGG